MWRGERALLEQLAVGGRLAAIVGLDPIMRMTIVQRHGSRFDTTQPWDTSSPRLTGFAEPSPFKYIAFNAGQFGCGCDGARF